MSGTQKLQRASFNFLLLVMLIWSILYIFSSRVWSHPPPIASSALWAPTPTRPSKVPGGWEAFLVLIANTGGYLEIQKFCSAWFSWLWPQYPCTSFSHAALAIYWVISQFLPASVLPLVPALPPPTAWGKAPSPSLAQAPRTVICTHPDPWQAVCHALLSSWSCQGDLAQK